MEAKAAVEVEAGTETRVEAPIRIEAKANWK